MGLTWVDWVIAGIFGYFILKGFRKGFVQQLFELIGSIVSLILAFHYYKSVGAALAPKLSFSTPLANIIAFIFIVVVISGLVSFFGKRWHHSRKSESIAVVDGGLGAVFGGCKAGLIIMVTLMILLALPWEFIHTPIETSEFANDLLRLAPIFYQVQDAALPSDFPRMIISAEGIRWRSIDDKRLISATCFACGQKTEYKGIVKKGALYYPQTVCPRCGRVSDGCLTFEGYHMIHNQCPYEKLGSLGTTDCKIWPNVKPATVKGKCTVCGRTQ